MVSLAFVVLDSFLHNPPCVVFSCQWLEIPHVFVAEYLDLLTELMMPLVALVVKCIVQKSSWWRVQTILHQFPPICLARFFQYPLKLTYLLKIWWLGDDPFPFNMVPFPRTFVQFLGGTSSPFFWFKLHKHSHRIHVWYIYLHLINSYGKCRYIHLPVPLIHHGFSPGYAAGCSAQSGLWLGAFVLRCAFLSQLLTTFCSAECWTKSTQNRTPGGRFVPWEIGEFCC